MKINGSTIEHLSHAFLGYIQENDSILHCGMENARLKGRELVEIMRPRIGREMTLVYASVIMRNFRERVLASFFEAYPICKLMRHAEDIRNAVKIYTTNPETGYYWKPNRNAVVDYVQKQVLQNTPRTQGYTTLSQAGYACHYVAGKFAKMQKIKPVARQELDYDMQFYSDTVELDTFGTLKLVA